MKGKFGIGLFVFSFVSIYLIAYGTIGNQKEEENLSVEESVSTDGQAYKEECYYLYEKNGYIIVYLSDQKTPYEYTDILIEDLPELLRQEIRNGKYIKDKEELYGFLENYSS